MPLAIVRRPVGDWPAAFTLDDSMAMAPNLKLSGFAQVVVSARISRSGNATPQPGDLIGQSAPASGAGWPGAAHHHRRGAALMRHQGFLPFR